MPDPSEIGENWNSDLFDCGLDGLCPGDEGYNGQDYGEGDGIWNSFDWNNNGLHDNGDVWDSNEWTPLDENLVSLIIMMIFTL